MILILDYGASNLHSVKKAFDFLNIPSKVSNNPRDIPNCDKVVLPGVGAFGKGIEALHEHGFSEALVKHVAQEKPLFGICLGMQLLLTVSEEMGTHHGLNFIEGKVVRFDSSVDKVPQIGWNNIVITNPDSLLFKGIMNDSQFYFVHSYYCILKEQPNVAATSFYADENFAVAIEKNRIFGVQFHPEKSGDVGLEVLKNFARI